ncbi:MFS transporter [Aeromicrobium sp. CTD01-1L150]|uniref:MFS transporter n=1 Tax=Aeromicrobium sp. CTD01-1L150 TaxID=3341830 RepID=UPI0035C03369
MQVLTFAVRPNLSYAVLDAGGSVALVGAVAAAFALPALLVALPTGHAVDRVGERPALVVGSVALLGACLLAVLAKDSILLLVVATVIIGCGHLLSVVGDQALIANLSTNRSLESRFGLYAFAASVGQVVGPLVLALPGGDAATPPIAAVFGVCAAVSAVLLLLSVALASSDARAESIRASLRSATGSLLRLPGIPRAILASSLVLTSIDLFLAYLPALGQERGFGTAVVSAMLVVRSLTSMLSRLFIVQLISIAGRRRLLVMTLAISAVTLLLMPFPLPVSAFLVLSALYGFVIGTCQPITMAWVSELAPSGMRGLAMSLRVAGNRVGQTAVPVALGPFAVLGGAGGVLAITGGALLVAAWASRGIGRTDT